MLLKQIRLSASFWGVMYLKIYYYEANLDILFQIWIFVF